MPRLRWLIPVGLLLLLVEGSSPILAVPLSIYIGYRIGTEQARRHHG